MSWLAFYFWGAAAFTVGWLLCAIFNQRRPDQDRDLCGVPSCTFCSPHERRRREPIPDGVLILKSPKQRPHRASTN